jgi:hypothetical protein
MLCDTCKGVVYGTRFLTGGFAIANPYMSRVIRVLFGIPAKREWGFGAKSHLNDLIKKKEKSFCTLSGRIHRRAWHV